MQQWSRTIKLLGYFTGICFPANPDLANILGDMDVDFENLRFFFFSGFQVSRFPGLQISKSPDLEISRRRLRLRRLRLTNFQIPTRPLSQRTQ